MKTHLDYSSLANAVAQLQKSLDYLRSDLAREDPDLREQFRAATIQAFECGYELAIKMIRKQLAEIDANPSELSTIKFADLMRKATDAGIIRDAPHYMRYRELRKKTTHPYDADQAETTVASMNDFLDDLRFLLKELEKRNRETD